MASAQVKSALLLAGLYADDETVLEQPALSRDHTERMFAAMGVQVVEDGLTLRLRPGPLRAVDVTVPGDISSAAFWLVAGACHPDAEVRVHGVGTNPSRTGILDALESMGADIHVENERTEGGEPVSRPGRPVPAPCMPRRSPETWSRASSTRCPSSPWRPASPRGPQLCGTQASCG